MALSCAKPPTEELNAAKAAVQAARQAEADTYAPQTLAEAEGQLQQTEENITNKQYEPARNLALQAKATAERAQQEALQGKENARQEAQTALANAREAINTARVALETGPVMGKDAKETIEMLWANMTEVEGQLSEAESALGQEDLMAAGSQAMSAKAGAEGITVAVEDVMERSKKAEESMWYMRVGVQ
jgi:chromosome segregation ATPase